VVRGQGKTLKDRAKHKPKKSARASGRQQSDAHARDVQAIWKSQREILSSPAAFAPFVGHSQAVKAKEAKERWAEYEKRIEKEQEARENAQIIADEFSARGLVVTTAPARDPESSRRHSPAPRKTDTHEAERKKKIFEIMTESPALEGLQYCKALTKAGIPPLPAWTRGQTDCSKSYLDFYNETGPRKNPHPYRHRISSEKSRIQALFRKK
jgi:hypothetical protein